MSEHVKISENCDHCGELIISPHQFILNGNIKRFCCSGCETVYQILNNNGLTDYYELKKSSPVKSSPIHKSDESYEYLDHQEFLDKYATCNSNERKLDFFLEGVHCVACLWLIENLPKVSRGVINAKLNMQKSIVSITINNEGSFSNAAKQLALFGYKPHPVLNKADVEEFQKKEDRKMLIKIAVAFASAGNIMLLAFSIYSGASSWFTSQFNLYSLILFLPILLYSASPFYSSAYNALKNKQLNIDIPIVVALFLGTISGLVSIFTNYQHIYFDSLSTLVFLLLSARFLLKKSQQRSLDAVDIASFFTSKTAHKWNEENKLFEDIHSQFLKQYDLIKVKQGEMIPVDGIVIDGHSSVNNSLLTGESIPSKIAKNDYVYSGTINIDQDITVQVLNINEQTRLGKILTSVENGWNQKSDIVTMTEMVAKNFVFIIFTIALITLVSVYLITGNIEDSFTRAFTLIIITCPCALGLTTPLALSLTLGKLAKMGIIVKSEKIIEKLYNAKNIFIDKTGTLTNGKFTVSNLNNYNGEIWDNLSLIYNLEKKSKHPIALALQEYVESEFLKNGLQINVYKLDDYLEIPGIGVSALIENINYSIKSSKNEKNNSQTCIALYKTDKPILEIYLEDQLREDSYEAINQLNKFGISPKILSGDALGPVKHIATKLNLLKSNYYYRVSPEDKSKIVESSNKAIMLGDGANDAIALSKAYVGIAVKGSAEISLRAADIYLSQNGIKNVISVIAASRETIKIIKRNIIFSILYNIIGSYLAISGQITPLIAAILMPLSSITVLISTLVATKNFRKIFANILIS